MLVNHPKHKDVEIPQHTRSDQQAHSEPILAVLSPSPLPGDMSIPLPQPSPSRPSTPLQERALRYLERKRIRQERTITQMQSIKTNGVSTDAIPKGTRFTVCPLGIASTSTDIQTRFSAPVSPSALYTPYKNLTHTAQRHRKILLRHISRKSLRRDRLGKQRSFQRFWLTLFSAVAALIIIFLTSVSGSAFIAYRFYISTQEQYASQIFTLHSLMPRDNLKMFDTNGIPIGQLTDQGIHTSVVYNQISTDMINATVSTEDKCFLTNPGIDIQRIVQAD